MTEETHHAAGKPAAAADRSSAHCSECHHPTRRRPSLAVLVAFLAGSVLSGLTAAVAATTFTDVTDANPFKADIDWAAANGVTEGYPDGTFKPSKSVTRGQMVAFLHRYNDTFEIVHNSFDWGPGYGWGLSATCPAGKVAVAGGGRTSDAGMVMTDSYPFNLNAWRVLWESKDGTSVNPGPIDVWALCMPT